MLRQLVGKFVSRAQMRAGILTAEIQNAIESAVIVTREPNDDGPRVAVISSTLRGSFIYSRAEASRRVARAFPELSAVGVARAVGFLEGRVKLRANPPPVERRRDNWMHGWRGAETT